MINLIVTIIAIVGAPLIHSIIMQIIEEECEDLSGYWLNFLEVSSALVSFIVIYTILMLSIEEIALDFFNTLW